MKRREKVDFTKLAWCHIYAQNHWHCEATIIATRSALELLRDAIERALKTGKDQDTDSLFVRDGEGYHVEIKIRDMNYIHQQPVPYVADYARSTE